MPFFLQMYYAIFLIPWNRQDKRLGEKSQTYQIITQNETDASRFRRFQLVAPVPFRSPPLYLWAGPRTIVNRLYK